MGGMPIYEPGTGRAGYPEPGRRTPFFHYFVERGIEGCGCCFYSRGTPPDEDGSADLHYVLDVAREIGEIINNYIVVVTKSTVPVGTNYKVKGVIQSSFGKTRSRGGI